APRDDDDPDGTAKPRQTATAGSGASIERVRTRLAGGAAVVALVTAGCGGDGSPRLTPTGPLPVAPATTGPGASTTGPGSTRPRAIADAAHPCLGTTPPARWARVVWIVMENKPADRVTGHPDTTYLSHLVR